MSNKVININNVCFHYQEEKNASLTHVNLQINEGEVVVLCGDIYNLGSKVSTVFQNPRSQFFCVDVRSELAFGAENLNYDKDEIIKRIEDASHELKFEYLLGRTMFQLSDGERQKVACASVSITDNPIVVLDEPTSGLDYFHMQQVANCIKNLQEKDKTIFLITHDIELVYSCCNYVLQIENGMVKELYQLNRENESRFRYFFRAI